MTKRNKVIQINLMGGLVGLMATNPRKALDDRIDAENKDGWNAVYFMPHKDTNLLVILAKIAVLIVTIGLWTWGAGFMVLFEREQADT